MLVWRNIHLVTGPKSSGTILKIRLDFYLHKYSFFSVSYLDPMSY